jgi:capsular exopolysaccharide synthesis family protein
MTAIINESKISEVELDTDLGYGKLFSTLIRRRNWFLGVLGAALSVATITALNQEPVYESSFQLLIESVYRSKESDLQNNVYEDLNVEIENYATQLEVMRSSQLLEKARQALSSEYPDLELETLEDNYSISQVQGDNYEDDRVITTVFEAEYIDNDPVKTKRILETIIQVYQDYTLEQQQARLAQGLSFIDAQLPIARSKVTQAENALENFRKTNNLIDPEQRAESATEDLKNVQAQKRQAKVGYQNTLAQINAWQNQLQRTPEQASVASRLSQSSRYETLLEEMQKTELALNAKRTQFNSNHPEVQSLEEKLQQERSMLKAEAQNILGVAGENLNLSEADLLKEGQLGDNDLESANQLATLKTQLDSLKAQEKSLEAAEQELQAEIDRFPSLIVEHNRLKTKVDVRRATAQQLLSARQKLGIEIDRGGLKWQVVEPPVLGEDETPSKLKTLLAGVVVGSFLGIGAAFGREALDDIVHTPQQLEQESTYALLGVIPDLPEDNISQENSELLLNQFSDSDRSIEQAIYLRPLRESLDLVYQNLRQLSPVGQHQSLLITSVEPEADSLTLLLGLASSAARANQKVLLIDTNFRFPKLHEKFGINNERGLSNLLMGEVTDSEIQTVSLFNEEIDVLTAGSSVSDPVKLLSSSRLRELMYVFERNYDLVLLSSPPVLGYVDMLQTAQYCQGVVLVEKIDRISKSQLSKANALLSQINIVGIVADGGEESEAKLRAVYQPQWESMLKELPPASNKI